MTWAKRGTLFDFCAGCALVLSVYAVLAASVTALILLLTKVTR